MTLQTIVGTQDWLIVMNLRAKENATHSRHWQRPSEGQTACGLSMKKGHAWAMSNAQFVTCQKCTRIHDKAVWKASAAELQERICPACNGDGWMPCPVCMGENCPTCGGTDRVRCLACRGTGSVERRRTNECDEKVERNSHRVGCSENRDLPPLTFRCRGEIGECFVKETLCELVMIDATHLRPT